MEHVNKHLKKNHTHTHTHTHTHIYTANLTTVTMAKFIGDRVTYNKSWPPRSPYLTVPDSYFLRYLKQNVYTHLTQSTRSQ
jgi:hypothetical protein